MRSISKLLRQTNGTAMLELAMITPVLLLMLAGTIEYAMMTFAGTLLEGGLREASRFGITGHIPQGMTREQRIAQIVNQNAAGLFTVSAGDIETLVYQNFSTIGMSEPFTDSDGDGEYDPGEEFTDLNCNEQWDEDIGLPGLGGGNEVVLYTITHEWQLLTGLFDAFMGENGSYTLQANVAVRNEPFTGNQTVCPEA